MKRLGMVEDISYDGSLLVRSQFAPRKGDLIVDKRNKIIGRVAKVFGPVKEPFASVKPEAKAPLSILGSEVYIGEGYDEKENRRGGRSNTVSRMR